MYNTGVEIPRVSFSALSYSGIPANSYFMGFDLDNSGKLSKLDNTGTVTVIEGGGGSGGGISLTDLSVNAPLTYNNITGVFNIGQSSGSTSGFLSSTDWNTFNNKIGAVGGTVNYITKFTPNGTTLGNSQIQDNGTNVSIGTTLDPDVKVNILTNESYGIWLENTSQYDCTGIRVSLSTPTLTGSHYGFYTNISSAYNSIGLNAIVTATSQATGAGCTASDANLNNGLSGSAYGGANTSSINHGVLGFASGGVESYGGKFEARNGSTHSIGIWSSVPATSVIGNKYSVKLEDGSEAEGKFLKSVTSDGKANWANITAADVSGVQGSLTLTTTGSSGAATLVGNTLNIPQYSGGGGGGGLTWPAHIEYNETNKTLWVKGNTTSIWNTAYGARALSTSSVGLSNSAFGFDALRLNQASYNSAFGYAALSSNTTGGQNTAVGNGSLYSNTTAIYNTAVGIDALSATTTGGSNTAIGAYALSSTTTSYNTAVGHNALQILQTGSNNTMVGAYAASSFTGGSYNVALGDNIVVVQTASSNVMIGSGARADSYNSSIVIGRSAQANGDNQFVIGSSSYNAGTIATESVSTNRTWRVKINGTDYKILLATV